jgi:hypothetical protein
VGTACHLNKEEELCKIIFKCCLNIEELDKSVQLAEDHFDITMELNIYFVLTNHRADRQMVFMFLIDILLSKVKEL